LVPHSEINARSRSLRSSADVAPVTASTSRQQGRDDAETGEGEKTSVRDLIETVAVGVVAVEGKSGKLLGNAGLKAGVVAASTGTEFVDVTEARVKRLVVGERRKASIADVLIAVELYLVGFVDGTGPDIVHAEGAARA